MHIFNNLCFCFFGTCWKQLDCFKTISVRKKTKSCVEKLYIFVYHKVLKKDCVIAAISQSYISQWLAQPQDISGQKKKTMYSWYLAEKRKYSSGE